MKTLPLFCCCLLAGRLAAQPALTIVRAPEFGHKGVAAYWTNPTNQIWVAEWSTNLVTWTRTSNESVDLGTGSRYTATGTGWTRRWYVRLRLHVEAPSGLSLTKT